MFIIYALLLISTSTVLYFLYAFQYWKKRNVPHVEPRIPLGNVSFRKPFFQNLQETYNKVKAIGEKHAGFYMFGTPFYVLLDPDMIRKVMSKDFSHFVDRGIFYNEKDDPLSAHLFSLQGQKWKNLRAKLTPTFTSGKMKMMFNTLVTCAAQMEEELYKVCKKGEALDVKDISSRYTIDVIGSCAFGIDCNTFENPNSEFAIYGRKIFQFDLIATIKAFLSIQYPELSKKLHIKTVHPDVSKFFMKLIRDMIRYREETNSTRKDFLQLLIELKNQDGDCHLNINEMAAQAFLFFAAGFETSSTTISFCLFELARNQDVQNKLRDEIRRVLDENKGELTYETLGEMKYLQAVVDETLRKYPPVGQLIRTCTVPYTFEETGIKLKLGDKVMIPAYALHHDGEYYPDPEKFDPERFTEKDTSERHQYVYLPFGEGPRNCIGSRFGLMQTKVGLAYILKNFKLTPVDKNEKDIEFNPLGFIVAPKHPILLNCEKI